MQTLSLKLKGLYTNPNNLGTSVPDGALEQALNMTIDAEDIAEVRRGFSRLTGAFPNSTDRAEKYFIYQSQLLASYTGNKLAYYKDAIVSGNVVDDSIAVTNVVTTDLIDGFYVYGTGIPAGTTLTINASDATSINLSSNATITGNDVSLTCSGWVDYTGTHEPNSSTFKIQSAEANQNFYYTTASGVQKLSAYNDTTSVDAGVPRGLDITATTVPVVSGGFLSPNSQVAYRVVWGLKDANNNVILGAPSNQTVAIGSDNATTCEVSLAITIPSPNNAITTVNFVQIYRSRGSAGIDISPTEDMQLVYENNPTTAELTAGTMTVVDNLPYVLMGAFLYTSPSEEGIGQSNEQPPQCKCIETFKDSVFYGNTTAKQRLNLTMAGVGQEITCNVALHPTNVATNVSTTTTTAWAGTYIQQSNGASNVLAANATVVTNASSSSLTLSGGSVVANTADLALTVSSNVTIAGVTYIPRGEENSVNGAFKVTVSGSPSQDIADTAQSLVRVINATVLQSNVNAYYMSSVDDLPGEILIEEVDLGGDAFTATTPIFGTEWNPVLPTSGTAVQSDSERQKNGVYFSKYQEPEGVPLFNNFRIGSAAAEILKMISVRDSLFVMKEDGIWRILGQDANDFRVEVVDLSTILFGPETAQELNNQLFALTNQGVVIVTETGVSIVSNPIEDQILDLYGSSTSTIKETSFAIPYRTDRSYLLFMVSDSADDNPTQCLRYNTIHANWTKWETDIEAGILDTTVDKLILSDNASNYTLQERKAYNYTDHIDEKEQINITAANSVYVTVSDASNFRVNDLLYQTTSRWSRVVDVDADNDILTVSGDLTLNTAAYDLGDHSISNSAWTEDSAVRYAYIPITLEWLPNSADNPGILKHFKETSVFVTDTGFTNFALHYKTELDNNFESVSINGADLAIWGLGSWGGFAWPGDGAVQGTFRTYTPIAKARGSLLTIKLTSNIAYRVFGLQGISIPFSKGNEWVRNN